jgi:hypothetical protein
LYYKKCVNLIQSAKYTDDIMSLMVLCEFAELNGIDLNEYNPSSELIIHTDDYSKNIDNNQYKIKLLRKIILDIVGINV